MFEIIGGVAIIILLYFSLFKYFENQEYLRRKTKEDYNFLIQHSYTFKQEVSGLDFEQNWRQIKLIIDKFNKNSDIKNEIKISLEFHDKVAEKEKLKELFIFMNLSILDRIIEKDGLTISGEDLIFRCKEVYSNREMMVQFLSDLDEYKCAVFSDNSVWFFIGIIKHPLSGASIYFNDYKQLSIAQKEAWKLKL